MALHELLSAHRAEILARTREEIAKTTAKGLADPIDSLSEFFDELVAALRADTGMSRESGASPPKSASDHGRQRLRLGFSITDLVHDYGALCNSITEFAKENGIITAREYQLLNSVLDEGIAAAAEEYSLRWRQASARAAEKKANTRLGYVAHELRNTLSTALLAFDALRRGHVGMAGRTSNVLERSLYRMRTLIDKSLTEIRLAEGLSVVLERTNVRDLLDEVVAASSFEARAKESRVLVDADATLEASVDREMMVSVVTNLVQNGIKYSPRRAEIQVRAMPSREPGGGVTIEVEDNCGGLAEGRIEQLFTPFVRGQAEGQGLGIGLALARQAVEAHSGRIHVRNRSGTGCIFVVHLPAMP
jgi:signal transduction histidine kinase